MITEVPFIPYFCLDFRLEHYYDGTARYRRKYVGFCFKGNVKLSAADAAKAIREALEKFAKTKPNNLRRIDVIVFQNVMLHDFQSTINVPPISTSEGLWFLTNKCQSGMLLNR